MPVTNSGKFVEIHAPWWAEDEVVKLRGTKTYFMQTRAQSHASVIPEGYTADQLRGMSETELAKLDMYDPGKYHESLFKDMIVSSTLRYSPILNDDETEVPGDIIPLNALLDELPEEDGKYIADEIAKLGKGRREASKKLGLDFRGTA